MAKEILQPEKNSSATAAPSFALDGNPENLKLTQLRALYSKVEKQLTELEATPIPPVKLYQKARQNNVNRLKTNLVGLREAIRYEENADKA